MTAQSGSSFSIRVGSYHVGDGQPLLLIAGPCVLQSRELTMEIAERLHRDLQPLNVQWVFKASFDKANRTSLQSYRGVGLDEGLSQLAEVRDKLHIPVTTDIHLPEQAEPASQVCDLLQIPAFLCRQTDLLVAAGSTGRAVHVKKGQFLSPDDMAHVVAKLKSSGCDNVLLGERGTFFGYGRLVNDFRSLVVMRRFGAAVLFDATHSVQQPGGLGDATGGEREMVAPLARAAIAVGVDGLFFETHPRPHESPSDGANMVPLDQFADLVSGLVRLRQAAGEPLGRSTTA